MGQLREHSFELKGYLLRTNIIPHSVFLLGERDAIDLRRDDLGGDRTEPLVTRLHDFGPQQSMKNT